MRPNHRADLARLVECTPQIDDFLDDVGIDKQLPFVRRDRNRSRVAAVTREQGQERGDRKHERNSPATAPQPKTTIHEWLPTLSGDYTRCKPRHTLCPERTAAKFSFRLPTE